MIGFSVGGVGEKCGGKNLSGEACFFIFALFGGEPGGRVGGGGRGEVCGEGGGP